MIYKEVYNDSLRRIKMILITVLKITMLMFRYHVTHIDF